VQDGRHLAGFERLAERSLGLRLDRNWAINSSLPAAARIAA
jgi:hypothetical protein